MKVRFVITLALGLAASLACSVPNALAQDAPAGQAPQGPGSGGGGYQGQRGGRGAGMGGGMMGMMGRGVMGTVTEITADHYTVKTEAGETYTVHYSVNTRILKQAAGGRGPGGGQGGGGGDRPRGGGNGGGYGGGGGNPPQAIKATDIKVGDAIGAMGEVDATAKSVGAVTIVQIDPERARQMREMQANHGKTWIMGKVTAIDGVKVSILDSVDNTAHSFTADENTTFRKRRDPITLADIQVGDVVRVEGAVKDGGFLATTVNAMGMPPGGTPNVPRNGPAPQQQ